MNKPQMFCFTFAGGNSTFYDTIEKDLPEVDFVKPDYSGHGTRRKEPLYKSPSELADDMYMLVKENYSGGEYALLGYSMGTITLVEVLRRIISDNAMLLPEHIFLAAHIPQTFAGIPKLNSDELTEWVKQRTISFGTVPEKLINNKAYWRTYLPLYTADYSIIGSYRFEDLTLNTDIPATIFYSQTDTSLEKMEQWKRYFTGDCEFFQFSGTHFFIQQHHAEMAQIIRSRLLK